MQRIKSRSNFRRLVGNTCFLFYLQKRPVCFWLTVEGKPAAALYWNALLPVPCSLTTHHKQQQKKKTSKAVSLRGESETQEKFVYSSPGRHGDYRRLGEAERREKLCNLCQICERGRHETIWRWLVYFTMIHERWYRKALFYNQLLGYYLKFNLANLPYLLLSFFCSSPSEHLYFWIDWWRKSLGSLTKIKVQKSKPKCEMMPGSLNLN